MTRRLTRRQFLAFAGAMAGAGAAGAAAAMLGGPPASESVPTATSLPAAPPTVVATPTTTPAAASPPTTVVAELPASVVAATIPVICREAWGARPVRGELVPHTIERLTVHHTAVRLDSNRDAPARARGHQRYHQDTGWPDLAYHYVIDAKGHVYEGRPFSARGDTFTSYDPSGHFLVCCEGNFDQQDVPDAQVAALAAMLAWASDEFGVDPATIGGHRDYAGTTCPGDRLAVRIDDGSLRGAVEALLASGGVSPTGVCDEAGRALVASIEAGTDDGFTTSRPGFHLRYDNASGPADASIPFGESDWVPVAGDTGG